MDDAVEHGVRVCLSLFVKSRECLLQRHPAGYRSLTVFSV